jgi:hypothetical protein
MISVPLLFLLPLAILMRFGSLDLAPRDSTAALSYWHSFMTANRSAVAILFLLMLSAAFFTTINTYLISFGQLHQVVRDRNILRGCLPKDSRKAMLLFVCLAAVVGVRLDPMVNSVVGVYAGSLLIPVFFTLYVRPLVSRLLWRPVATSVLLQAAFGGPILVIAYRLLKSSRADVAYSGIPVAILAVELLSLATGLLLGRRKEEA